MLKLWQKVAIGVAAALVAAAAFAQSGKAAPVKDATAKTAAAKTKKATKAPVHKTTSSSAHHSSTTKSSKTRTVSSRKGSRRGKNSKTSWRRGQQKVDADRTRQIQDALIREHYLSGTASGKWDASTEDALRRMQADNGWQNKTVPDSRALIKLGLGPSHDHLLNPESAMTTSPGPPHATGVAGPTGPTSQTQR